jgi:hypothetical protein
MRGLTELDRFFSFPASVELGSSQTPLPHKAIPSNKWIHWFQFIRAGSGYAALADLEPAICLKLLGAEIAGIYGCVDLCVSVGLATLVYNHTSNSAWTLPPLPHTEILPGSLGVRSSPGNGGSLSWEQLSWKKKSPLWALPERMVSLEREQGYTPKSWLFETVHLPGGHKLRLWLSELFMTVTEDIPMNVSGRVFVGVALWSTIRGAWTVQGGLSNPAPIILVCGGPWESNLGGQAFTLGCPEQSRCVLGPPVCFFQPQWSTHICVPRPSGNFKDTQTGCGIHSLLCQWKHPSSGFFMMSEWQVCASHFHWSQISHENHNYFFFTLLDLKRKSPLKSVIAFLSVGALE